MKNNNYITYESRGVNQKWYVSIIKGTIAKEGTRHFIAKIIFGIWDYVPEHKGPYTRNNIRKTSKIRHLIKNIKNIRPSTDQEILFLNNRIKKA